MPPVYLRTQQLSWMEIGAEPPARPAGGHGQGRAPGERTVVSPGCYAQLKSARVELQGATRFERFLARARNPHAAAPKAVAGWPAGPGYPVEQHLRRRQIKRAAKRALRAACDSGQR
jgi:hypothetical protein